MGKNNKKQNAPISPLSPQMGNPNEIPPRNLAPKPISKDDRSEEPVDIMRKLEQAIANGNHKEASLLAKEVTKLQISTKLSLKELTEKKTNNKKVEKINLSMYVEDRTSYNGPVQVTVKPTFTVAELKEHVQCEFEIPIG